MTDLDRLVSAGSPASQPTRSTAMCACGVDRCSLPSGRGTAEPSDPAGREPWCRPGRASGLVNGRDPGGRGGMAITRRCPPAVDQWSVRIHRHRDGPVAGRAVPQRDMGLDEQSDDGRDQRHLRHRQGGGAAFLGTRRRGLRVGPGRRAEQVGGRRDRAPLPRLGVRPGRAGHHRQRPGRHRERRPSRDRRDRAGCQQHP